MHITPGQLRSAPAAGRSSKEVKALHVKSEQESLLSRESDGPAASTFRKARCGCSVPYHSPLQCPRQNSRTCFEAPFGEVVRATGPMARVNPFRFSTKWQDDETDLLYYGLRYYSAGTGRWLSKDPLGEGNLYFFVCNNALSAYDVLGLWKADVHDTRTRQWAGELGISASSASAIGIADNDIDTIYNPTVLSDVNFSWHFNRSTSGDSRLKHNADMVTLAQRFCNWSQKMDAASTAARFLGYGLHPLQDWVAHGDFDRKNEAPRLTWLGTETAMYIHNFAEHPYPPDGFFSGEFPDYPGQDASGQDGRATSDVMHWVPLSNQDRVGWTEFHAGSQRIRLTENLTKEQVNPAHQPRHEACQWVVRTLEWLLGYERSATQEQSSPTSD